MAQVFAGCTPRFCFILLPPPNLPLPSAHLPILPSPSTPLRFIPLHSRIHPVVVVLVLVTGNWSNLVLVYSSMLYFGAAPDGE